jgi:hypothetical protein
MNKMAVTVFVGLIVAAPAFAGTDLRGACANDIKTLCPGVQPGGGHIKSCMKEHKDQLSTDCKNALADQAKAQQGGQSRRQGSASKSAQAE